MYQHEIALFRILHTLNLNVEQVNIIPNRLDSITTKFQDNNEQPQGSPSRPVSQLSPTVSQSQHSKRDRLELESFPSTTPLKNQNPPKEPRTMPEKPTSFSSLLERENQNEMDQGN